MIIIFKKLNFTIDILLLFCCYYFFNGLKMCLKTFVCVCVCVFVSVSVCNNNETIH